MFQNVLKVAVPVCHILPSKAPSAVSKVHAMCQWYGYPSVFITITVDEALNCLSLRMCFLITNHANFQFPCPGDELFRDNIPIQNGNLMKLINAHLLGLVPDRLPRKTENYWKFPLGMFGTPTAAMHAMDHKVTKPCTVILIYLVE